IAPLARRAHGSGDWSQRRVIATHGIQRNSDHQASGIIPEELMGVLDGVRAHAEAVSKSARFVRVQTDAIERYAASLPLSELANPELDAATHYLGPSEATLAYVLTLDA